MARNQGYRDYIVDDVLGHIEGITSRALFGGWGIYKDGLIVGIIVGSEFYAKVAKENIVALKQQGEIFFQYSNKHSKTITLPYLLLSEEVLENKDKISDVIQRSCVLAKKEKRGTLKVYGTKQ